MFCQHLEDILVSFKGRSYIWNEILPSTLRPACLRGVENLWSALTILDVRMQVRIVLLVHQDTVTEISRKIRLPGDKPSECPFNDRRIVGAIGAPPELGYLNVAGAEVRLQPVDEPLALKKATSEQQQLRLWSYQLLQYPNNLAEDGKEPRLYEVLGDCESFPAPLARHGLPTVQGDDATVFASEAGLVALEIDGHAVRKLCGGHAEIF